MQHQGRNDAARNARDEVLVLEVAQDVKLARSTRRAAALDRRHVERYAVAVSPPFLAVRYRSVIGNARFRILVSASNARLHSATYLLVRGRHCRRAVVASHVAEITSPCAFLPSSARSLARSRPHDHSWLPPIMQHRSATTHHARRTPPYCPTGQHERHLRSRERNRSGGGYRACVPARTLADAPTFTAESRAGLSTRGHVYET